MSDQTPSPVEDPDDQADKPSQAEGERDEPVERGTASETHPDVPRTEPSQAEGDRTE